MCLKASMFTTAAFDHKSASEGRSGAPLGDFWEHLGLPRDTLQSVISEFFSGVVPGRVPGEVWGAFFELLGCDFETL